MELVVVNAHIAHDLDAKQKLNELCKAKRSPDGGLTKSKATYYKSDSVEKLANDQLLLCLFV